MSTDDLSELQAVVDKVAVIDEMPEGDLRQHPDVAKLFELVDARIEASDFLFNPKHTEDFKIVWDAKEQDTTTEAGENYLTVAGLRANDRAFLAHGLASLKIDRRGWSGAAFSIPEDGVELKVVDRSSVPLPLNPQERVIITFLVEMDLFASIREQYIGGDIRRIATGTGCITFTDRRVIGVIYDEQIAERAKSYEVKAMPTCVMTPDLTTTLVFSIDRTQFCGYEDLRGQGNTGVRWVMERMTPTNLIGDDVDLRFFPKRTINGHQAMKPGKGKVVNAMVEFYGKEG